MSSNGRLRKTTLKKFNIEGAAVHLVQLPDKRIEGGWSVAITVNQRHITQCTASAVNGNVDDAVKILEEVVDNFANKQIDVSEMKTLKKQLLKAQAKPKETQASTSADTKKKVMKSKAGVLQFKASK